MAKDIYHDTVKTALVKDGWAIIDEGYQLQPDKRTVYFIDLLAEKYIIAKREKQIIIVEVKSFNNLSKTYDFHLAVGQYITYHTALEYLGIERQLYLAVPEEVFDTLFQREFVVYLVDKFHIQLLPFNPAKKTLVK